MSCMVLYCEFANYNLTWLEENVADKCTIDYLTLTHASEEEITTAVPSSSPTSFSKVFVASYISERLKHIVHQLCSGSPDRKFFVILKHNGIRGNPSSVHVEISSARLDKDEHFRTWFHYDIESIAHCNDMCRELNIWQKHLAKRNGN